MQNIAGQFRCDGGAGSHGNKDVGRSHRKQAQKVLGSYSDYRHTLSVQPQNLAHHIRSECRRARHNRWLITATGAVPSRSVSARKNRPMAGSTPKVVKYSGETNGKDAAAFEPGSCRA